MSNLLIVGSGGHGQVVADAAEEMGCWDKIAFVDNLYSTTELESVPMLGKISEAINFKNGYSCAVIAIGDNKLRMQLLNQFEMLGFQITNIIHPKACVSKYATLGKGSVVLAGAVVNANSKLGRGCIVNTSSSVDHGCNLGDGVHVSPGARLAGNVQVGDGSWIGVGASIINDISIGSHTIIGAGSVVIQSVEDELTVIGVPGKVKHQKL